VEEALIEMLLSAMRPNRLYNVKGNGIIRNSIKLSIRHSLFHVNNSNFGQAPYK
jgi:hypothetical protein